MHPTPRPATPAVMGAVVVLGLSTLLLGVWAAIDAGSFSDFVAFDDGNPHLVHDAGAFQVGVGASLLLALTWRDGLSVALGGYLAAAVVHVANHLADHRLGGHPSDSALLGIL